MKRRKPMKKPAKSKRSRVLRGLVVIRDPKAAVKHFCASCEL